MRRSAAIAFVGVGALALPALAYVVAPSSIVRQFAQAQAFDRVTPGTLIGRAHVNGSATELPARLELTKTTCKAELELAGGKATVSFANGSVESQGQASPALAAFTALACPLLTMHDVPAEEAEKAVQTFAKSIGVEYSLSSLSQLDGRVGLVVGARPRQNQRPQIWFDKVTNRPSRIIAAHGGKTWDIRLVDAGSIATNRLGPRATTVWMGSEKQLDVQWMAANPKAPSQSATSSDIEDEGDD